MIQAIVDRYLERAKQRDGSGWSAERFTVEPCVTAAAGDPAVLEHLLESIATAMELGADSRFEQHAIREAGHALGARPVAMTALVDGAVELVRDGIDPGWFVGLLAEPLAAHDDAAFATAWRALVGFARAVGKDRFAGYPFGTGLAGLLARGELEQLPDRLGLLAQLVRAAGRDAYGLFEHALPRLAGGGLDAGDLTDALQLALAMCDHGLAPGPTLANLWSPVQLDIATRLAKVGVDPALVIANAARIFDSLGKLEDGGDRLVKLASEMHRRGLRTLLFDDGLDVLIPLEHECGGLGERALQLIERMVERDLEPAIVMRWHLPRALGRLGEPEQLGRRLWLAEALVEHGVVPDHAIGYAARSLVELAGDAEGFRRLTGQVVGLVARLHALGVDHREVLFHDVARLAEAGGESQTFGELLEAMGELIVAWGAHDPQELLGTALPAAASESSGRPWVLAIALRAATKLARDSRFAEAVSLLTIGVKTAGSLAADGDAFAGALAAVEARYAALPPDLLVHASHAAGALAGTDVVRLDSALLAIGELHARHAASFAPLAPALLDLAKIAREPGVLGELVDHAIAIGTGERTTRIAAIASHAGATPEQARALLAALATTSAGALDRFGSLGRAVAPPAIPATLALVDRAFASITARQPLAHLLEQARTETTIRSICDLVPPLLAGEPGPILDGLYRARELMARSAHAWPYLIAPALVTAKQHASPLLRAVTYLSRGFDHEDDYAVVRDLITQRGLRAVDLIANLIAPALARNTMPSLREHREHLDRYLRAVGFADADVYAQYLEVADDPRRVAALRSQIDDLVRAIRTGDVPADQREHALFGIALQHVFPASITATRSAWLRLVETMPDRQEDLAFAPLAPLELVAGDWELAADAGALECFAWCGRVLPGDVAPREAAELGWELLVAWSEGRLAREPLRSELTRALLARSPAGTLPGAAFDSASQLRAIHALAGDQLAQLVEQAVLSARAGDPERADRLIRTRLAPAPRIGPGLVKAVQRTLAGPDAAARLAKQLSAFELPLEVCEQLRTAPDLRAALAALPVRAVEIAPGKELARIHADLVGQELAEMTAALSRALVYRSTATSITLDLEPTKRSIHAPIGLTAGVCVASDLELWNTPGFGHLALWHDGVCAGSVHLLVVAEGESRYLVLPGINPTLALLERVDAGALVKALLDRIAELARAAGFAGVWIPTSTAIHSNRRAVAEALAAMALPVRATSGHPFSYSPYSYRIDDVWIAA